MRADARYPIGAYAEIKSNGIYLDAVVGSIDGTLSFRKKIRGSKNEPEKLGRKLAKDLLKAGAGEILMKYIILSEKNDQFSKKYIVNCLYRVGNNFINCFIITLAPADAALAIHPMFP